MRFKQYINELSARAQKWTMKVDSNKKFAANFEIDGYLYTFLAFSLVKGTWDVAFVSQETEGHPDLNVKQAMRVFATVHELLKLLLKKYKPDAFSFSANNSKLNKLYTRWAKQIEKETEYKNLTPGGSQYHFAILPKVPKGLKFG